MKMPMTCALLILCSCAGASGALARRADSLEGRWRGELVKGMMRSPLDFEFSGRDGDYRGIWTSPALTAALSNVRVGTPTLASAGSLRNVQLGSSVRFDIAGQGAFEGTIRGETIEGTFRDEGGGGSFRLEREPEMTDEARSSLIDGSRCDTSCGLGDG